MVEIEFHLVDFMDARPLPRATVEFTLTVVPLLPGAAGRRPRTAAAAAA